MSKSVVLKPRLSEKAYALSEQRNTYVFDVPKLANRLSVAASVANQYEVEVASVKLATTGSKPLNSYRKRGRSLKTSKSGVRKAYVTLKEGSKLPIFAAENEGKKGAK